MITLLISIYWFLPRTITVSATAISKVSDEAVYRSLVNFNNWEKWWPEKQTNAKKDTLYFKGSLYHLRKLRYRAFAIDIMEGGKIYPSELILATMRNNTIVMEWKTNITSGYEPFSKIDVYKKSRTVQKNTQAILSCLKSFMNKTENLYGVNIRETKVKDSVIVVSEKTSRQYPSTSEIYAIVKSLKKHIGKKHAKELNYPMLNVDTTSGKFLTRVGIPVNKDLDVKGTHFAIKRMVLGNILVADVKGGPCSIKNALEEFERYLYDYRRRSPAIPYQTLITDRLNEHDTSKWVTKICYPVY
ncbi:MAG TPA: GyrI-like domain-containing protein [Flavitalea sp.]|nr:GyrI-like domain-containing protein [Flavitalea sp.]